MATTGDYYIDPITGTIQQQSNPIGQLALRQAGFQGPYATIADAKAAIGGKDVGGDVSSAAESAANSIPGVAQVGGFLGDLSSRNLWLRVAKVVVGLGLIIIGIVHLTHAQGLIDTAAKGAVLA
jgi:hypothetical protein